MKNSSKQMRVLIAMTILIVVCAASFGIYTITSTDKPVEAPKAEQKSEPIVLSTVDLSRDYQSYANKNIRVKGTVTRYSKGQYLIKSEGSKSGFTLEASKISDSLDKLIPSGVDTPEPVTIDATFKVDSSPDGRSTAVIVAHSIVK